MTRFRRAAAWAVVAVLAACGGSSLAAQGVTSAAVQGKVTQAGGQPVEGATVIITNTSTGQRFQVQTRAGGRYSLENVPPGGPYTISARGVGFQPNDLTGVQLSLGQRFVRDIELTQAVVQVQELTINAAVDPLINKGRTGAASTITDSAIANLPTLSRNFTDFVVTSPQVVATPNGGPSIGGSNNRFNNIQVDGGVNNDLFGLGASGVPGGQVNARPVPLDAVKEFQVLVSPFDVRQGGFTGGLVNAITKSGTNDFHWDAWVSLQNQGLVGKDSAGKSANNFTTTLFGGSIGGPIIRDKAQFFVSADIQKKNLPFAGQPLNAGKAGDAQVVADSLASPGFGAPGTTKTFSAGTPGDFIENNPGTNVFAKVTAQAGQNGQLEISDNYGKTTDENIISRSVNGNYQLTSGGYQIQNTTNHALLRWTTVFGERFNNELIAGYQTVRDKRPPNSQFATVIVQDSGGLNITTGAERFSQANLLNQDIAELTDNLSFDLNAQNRLTVGTHNEFFKFHNVFFPQSIGQWTFSSLANFQAGTPSRYDRALTASAAGIAGGRTDGPIADFSVRQFGLYLQDQWTPSPNMTVQVGLRADDPTFPVSPAFNQQLSDSMGINTGVFPSGNILWSPRVGFNYDAKGDGSLILRGGVGIFSGRPPYVWLSNAYSNTGEEQATLSCTGGNVPFFRLDSSYTSCGAAINPPRATINYFDKNFKFPQTFRVALGADKKLPWGMVGSVDFSYASNFNTLYLNDVNLKGVQSRLAGEGGRPFYGDTALANAGGNSPVKATGGSNFAQVIRHTNQSKDYSYAGTFQLAKNFSDHVSFTAGYTYSRSFDLLSQTSSIAASNLGFATLDGTLADRNVRPSYFDRPNKITISGTYHFPHNINASLIYIGVSGTPYAYVVSGDANGDGIGSSQQNDLFYVPKDSADISLANPADWSSLNSYINSESCLSSQRGTVMRRTSCRNPWANFLNANLAWTLPQVHGNRLEVSADIINVLHLLSSSWGVVRTTSFFEGQNIVRRTGFDHANARNIYSLALPTQNLQDVNLSRWRVQIGAKYTF